MADMNIKIGEYKVYSTGSVIGILGQPLHFSLFGLFYEIHFVTDDADPKANYIRKNSSENQLTQIITIRNFNEKTGVGVTKPIHVGNLANGEQLYLTFIVYTLAPDSGKLFHYTWLTKKA